MVSLNSISLAPDDKFVSLRLDSNRDGIVEIFDIDV